MHPHQHDDQQEIRRTRGRRTDDHKKNIEIHPVHLMFLGIALSLVTSVFGYLAKSWADNITYELRQFRLTVQELVKQNAQTDVWKEDVNRRLDSLENKKKQNN